MSEATRPCTHCGVPVAESERYCPSCGMPAPEPPRVVDDGPDNTERLHAAPPGAVEATPAPDEPSLSPLSPEPPPEPEPGVRLDWEQEFVAKVEETALLAGKSFENFIRIAVQKEVALVSKANKKMLTLDEVAGVLGIERSGVVKLVSAGKLRARKLDGEWKIDQEDIEALDDKPQNEGDLIVQELEQLADSAGLAGIITKGDAPTTASATLCFITQDKYLVFPRLAWARLGHNRVISEARDAVRRYIRRRDG